MLNLSDITLRRGPRTLLEGVTFAVHAGWRVGVVGRNGCGKSSLFALLTGELAADRGDFGVPRHWTVASVEQETPAVQQPALEYVLDGDEALRATQRSLAEAELHDDGAGVAAAHDQLAQIDGYAAPARAGAMLHGLGFTTEDQARPVAQFSGGWRMRLNLARALMRRADLLLLDEPTNHLDLDAVLWLSQALSESRGTLLLISHDRDFLDATTTHTLHLHEGTARLYTGGYSSFERQRAEQLAFEAAQQASQQRRLRELQRFVERFRAKASKARQAQSRLKMIERLGDVAAVQAQAEFTFSIPEPARLPAPLLRLRDGAVGYDGKPLLAGLHFTLAPGDRVGLLGANGAGKTTLMRSLAGQLPVLSGESLRDPHLAVGYFAQHQIDSLDGAASPLQHVLRLEPALSEQAARDHLGGFLFRGDRVFESVASFSGGERARLALALLVRRRPNLLLLDEPTNHLDMEMRQALEWALQEYAGAVVLVSHDRHLLRACCDDLWLVADRRVLPFDGDLDDYARWLATRRASANSSRPGTTPVGDRSAAPPMIGDGMTDRETARDRRRVAAEQRSRLRPLRDELKRLEDQMAVQQARLATLDRELAEPGRYAGADRTWIAFAAREQTDLRRTLAASEDRWLELSEALQSAQSALGEAG